MNWLEEMNDRIPHRSKYHGEDFYSHCLAVAYYATQRSHNNRVFLIAALLHDIGKPDMVSIRNGGASFIHHEKVDEKLLQRFISKNDKDYEEIKLLIESHMLPYSIEQADKTRPWVISAIERMTEIEFTYGKEMVDSIYRLNECDRKGTFVGTQPGLLCLKEMRKTVDSVFSNL
jgi:putative nucleotidyltransferase with HDIG domain